jgi:hypothetical protein
MPTLPTYLAVVGAPALRFEEAPTPPDVLPGRSAVASSQHAQSSVAIENSAAAQSITAAVTEPEPPPVETRPAKDPSVKTPPAILPDDARPTIRPEDFLPFFQIPGSATKPGDVTLLMPASTMTPPAQSAPIPSSSATYTQSPK